MNVERCNIETIDDNLNQFRQLKLRCYTQIQEHEFIRMVVVGLKFSFWKKLVSKGYDIISWYSLTNRKTEIQK